MASPLVALSTSALSDDALDKRERQQAVRRILRAHPEWADRRIGHLCRISPRAVARIRSRLMETFGGEAIGLADVRVGRDGRVRPLDAGAKRERIAHAVAECPDASLRSIARMVGVSPETVRSVRANLVQPPPASHAFLTLDVPDRVPNVRDSHWQPDRSFTSREDSAATAAFLERTHVSNAQLYAHVGAVPLSRVYEVADEARRRAAFWSTLAQSVEARARQGRS